MKFEWDDKKAKSNRVKHGLSFEEASSLFTSGVDYLEIFDQDHSDDEDRFFAIGHTARGVVIVVWAEVDEETIRIISARMATRSEANHLQEYLDDLR